MPSRRPPSARPTLLALCVALACATPLVATGQGNEGSPQPEPIDITADTMEHNRETQEVTAQGAVEVVRGQELRLTTDRATYNVESQRLQAEGHLRLQHGADVLEGEQADLNLGTDQGTISDLRMDLAGPGGKATAREAQRHDRQRATLREATYTNCDCDDPPWVIHADSVYLDNQENEFTARNATLRLNGTPIAYTPWWRGVIRPIRKSGFLTPFFRVSGGNGFEADIPYYFNLAPERDATVTLHPTSRRGVMGKGQYRYLGVDYQGGMEVHAIDDRLDDTFRAIATLDHRHQLGAWRLRAHGEGTKTRDYINDFQQELVSGDSRYLTSHAIADRLWLRKDGYTSLEAGTVWNQDLEAANDQFTVQQLPYLVVGDVRPITLVADDRLQLETRVQGDSFYQLAGDTTQRLDLAPTLRYRQPLHVGELSLAAGVRETAYWVAGDPTQAGGNTDNHHNREAAMVSLRLDAQLSRVYATPGADNTHSALKHVVEPTVQYVMNSATRQDDLPNYDAGLSELGVTNLFSENQFAGVDRISNGHSVRYGVTNRLLGKRAANGAVRELASLTVGQRWAPSGHREHQEDHGFSDVVAGVTVTPHERLSVAANSRFNLHGDDFRNADASLDYTTRSGHQMGLRYHMHAPETEDAILAARVQLTEQWSWLQEADYDLDRDGLKSWKTGFRYQHDCWSFELSGGRSVSFDTADHGGTWVGFLLTFQGLGGYGFNQ